MRNAHKQRDAQRNEVRTAGTTVRVDLGADLYRRATAKQRQKSHPRLAEFVRVAIIDYLERHGDAPGADAPTA